MHFIRDILVFSAYSRARLSKDLKGIPTGKRLPVKCRRLKVFTDLARVYHGPSQSALLY
ncbi:unnamed protein product [Penicillium camemberti]|uniref:Str. FM013 n=1 Tax=Penicillium camemberti (strain FM 013) TaxID=1429867 RepID=A0A0G4P5F9_PENC3|nr:unnamed protein product [Penicillium camemberti]